MVAEEPELAVPACPQGLSISRADFLRPDFTVDTFFIEQSIRCTPLDTLRDDLGLYLKVLRSSMIELINQDYADFVNLSTNLVGLDRGILALQQPLREFHTEIQTVHSELEGSLGQVRAGLARQADLREDKAVLAGLRETSRAVARTERLAAAEVTTDSAERLATEINQVQFAVWRLGDCGLVREQYKPRLEAVCDRLHLWLDSALLEAAAAGAGEEARGELARLCRVYSSIGRVEGAERAVREGIVRPRVAAVLEGEVGDLAGVCDRLLAILPEHLGPLLRLTTDSRRLVGGSLEGFHFLQHSYWPEVAEQWHAVLGHTTSAGNPAQFQTNYLAACGLLAGVEEQAGGPEGLELLRSTEPYTSFLAAWNLPLYFQIRFQEVARPLEEALGPTLAAAAAPAGPRLAATEQLITAVDGCFSPAVFLRPLAGRFLKLALQCVARYTVWAEGRLKAFGEEEGEGEEGALRRSATSTALAKEEAGRAMRKSASAAQLPEPGAGRPRVSAADLLLLHSDLGLLLPLLPACIAGHISVRLPDLSQAEPLAAVGESVSALAVLQPAVASALVAAAAEAPLRQVRGVLEIPRMYRRTGRDPPSRPCVYIQGMADSLQAFQSSHCDSCPAALLAGWLGEAGDLLLGALLLQVTDVLGNVAKMEESLRKLKKVRERQEQREVKPGLSDDDKIRLQLYLDVHFLLRRIGELRGTGTGVPEVTEAGRKIAEVVDSAVETFIQDVRQL